MLDLRSVRRDPEPARAALARRRDGSEATLERALALDARRRELLPETEALRARQNEASTAIGRARQAGRDASEEIAAMQEVARRVKALGDELAAVEADLDAALAALPNPPDPTAADEDEMIREVGEAGATGPDHLDLAGELIDMEAGARVAGSRFAYLRGDLVLLELALVRWALEELRARGFEPVDTARARARGGALRHRHAPRHRAADLPPGRRHAVPGGTSEVPLASLHAGEILDGGRLPLRYAGFSPCFRREAGAAGRDTRGIFRVHQFDKVEMFAFVEPDDAVAEHERLLAHEEHFLLALGIPYRVVNIGVTDLGASAAKKYDCEAWIPSQQRYREVTSTSNTTDFQARRLDIRYRPAQGGGPRHVATLNGTAVTWRHLIALLENGRRDDGTLAVPEVLHAWGAPAALRVGGGR